MESIRIQTGDTEAIEFLALDSSGVPLTGVTDLLVAIRRGSDNMIYDFDDDTFKASAWTSPTTALTEVDAANAPGWYRYSWDTSDITNPVAAGDAYIVTITQSPGTSVANVPAAGEIKAGGFVSRLLGLVNENTFIDTTVFNATGQMTSCRIRVFDTKAHVEAATDGGTETAGLIATYTMNAEYEGIVPPWTSGSLKAFRYKRTV